MDDLRLILILIGLVILGLIWLLHRPEGSSRGPGASRRDERRRREPRLGPEPEADSGADRSAETGSASAEPRQTTLPDLGDDHPEPPLSTAPDASVEKSKVEPQLPPESDWFDAEDVSSRSDPAPASGSVASEPDTGESPLIVTLYVRARDDRKISGLSLLDAAIKAGLRFGEMKIFHRRHRGEPRPVFSMANIKRPGSFDPSGWNLFETPGVTLFLTLPGPVSALDAWDAMLATGRRLSEILDADLMDDAQCLLTRQRIGQIREQMREFDRRAGLDGPAE